MKKIILATIIISIFQINSIQSQMAFSENSSDNQETEIYIFGNGGLRNSVTGAESDGSPANGALGLVIHQQLEKGKLDILIGYSVNDFNTISVNNNEQYGANLLIPDLTGRSFTLNFDYWGSENKFGIYSDLLIGNSIWDINGNEFKASPFLFNFEGQASLFGEDTDPFDVKLVLSLGLMFRGIWGNLAREDIIRLDNFDTKDNGFVSIEPEVKLRVGKTEAFVRLPYTFENNEDIKGFSKLQVVIGANITGDMVKIAKKNE